jgi:tripartite ATP-independent transporter DctM subunit
VIGCAGFGAICGSSIATTATMTRIALPEMLSRGYSQGLSTGAIAAGGTLGILIPPSIIMVIYAVLTEQFLLDLFKAAVLPGLLAILLYCVAVKLYVAFRPEAGPAGPALAYAERWAISVQSWRALMVLGLVAGGIYSGVFTATEAASVGVAISFVFFLISQHASLPNLFAAFRETAVSTGMILVMVIGANVFGYFVTVSNAPQELVTFVGGLQVAPIWIIACLLVMYVLIGAVFDEVAAMVLTLPFVLPMIKGFGYDPIWWGIMNVMIIEIGLICPPIGLNVFVLQGVARHVPLTTIYRGITPFLLMDFIRVALLLAFPVIALWLVH